MLTTKSKIMFLVEEKVKGEQNHVIGRCGESVIQKDAVFTLACHYRKRQNLEEFANPPQFLESYPVCLRVLEIEAYGRCLDELGPGMTGSVVLSGEGLDRIGPGSMLESAISVGAGR